MVSLAGYGLGLALKRRWNFALFNPLLIAIVVVIGFLLLFAMLFGQSHQEYVTLLPKSITTAIGMGVSEELAVM